MDTIFHNNVYSLLLTLIILYIPALICAVTAFISSFIKKEKPLDMLRINMLIKLIHISAYLFIFFVGLACIITIFTIGITIILIIFDIMTIALNGLIGLGGIIRSFREGEISIETAVFHGILQFIFCADIISSIVIYRKVKRVKYDYNHDLQLS